MPHRIQNPKFNKGDRVKLSAAGLDCLKPRKPDRLGTVIGFGFGTAPLYRVHWDGNSPASVDTFHEIYLELFQASLVLIS